MKKLICVEDDLDIRELIAYTLSNYGFEVKCCENASEFYKSLETTTPDLVLLDIMLPDEDGMSILKNIRKNIKTQRIPVILLTAKSGQMDKIKGLDNGADDYITKPFDIIELISRVNAVIRRTEYSTVKNDNIIDFHGLLINTDGREVTFENEHISLTYKEFELLYILVTNLNKVQTRDVLLDKIWGINFEGETRTLDVHVRTLRQKLKQHGEYIQTVRNMGYKAV